jgi:predicted nucleotidyltransferase
VTLRVDASPGKLNNPLPATLVKRLRTLIPEAVTILLFGSAASGHTDQVSDYDLLIITYTPLEREQRHQITSQVREEFSRLKLDLIFSSEAALIASLPYEPARRFWLENAVLLWGRWPVVESYPPLAKSALLSHLNIIAAEIDFALLEEAQADQARLGLDALEHLLHLKLALDSDYRNQAVWEAMEILLSAEAIRIIRLTPEKVTPAIINGLDTALRHLQAQLMERIKALPESTADQVWKDSWQEDEAAKAITVSSPVNR